MSHLSRISMQSEAVLSLTTERRVEITLTDFDVEPGVGSCR